jgi:predicted  nucleic acid-binding Zn-ribbon protein
LESQLAALQEEYDAKVQELKDKKQLVSVFEKELEEIREKQDNEMH